MTTFEIEEEKKWGYLEIPAYIRKERALADEARQIEMEAEYGECDECGDDEASENEPIVDEYDKWRDGQL